MVGVSGFCESSHRGTSCRNPAEIGNTCAQMRHRGPFYVLYRLEIRFGRLASQLCVFEGLRKVRVQGGIFIVSIHIRSVARRRASDPPDTHVIG